MLENGWIKLHRSLLKWEWYDNINTRIVFLHLLLTVNTSDIKWHGIEVKRGSRISSYAILATETKLSVQEVRTAINHLESTGEVTRCSHSKFTVFTIKNYDKHQGSTNKSTSNQQAKQQTTNKQSTSSQQQYKKVKEDKESKNITVCVCASDDAPVHTPQKDGIPSPDKVAQMAASIGAVWDAEEIQCFLDYNLDRGRKSGWLHAVKLWESHRKPKRPKKEPDIPQEVADGYLSCVNRFRKDTDG